MPVSEALHSLVGPFSCTYYCTICVKGSQLDRDQKNLKAIYAWTWPPATPPNCFLLVLAVFWWHPVPFSLTTICPSFSLLSIHDLVHKHKNPFFYSLLYLELYSAWKASHTSWHPILSPFKPRNYCSSTTVLVVLFFRVSLYLSRIGTLWARVPSE